MSKRDLFLSLVNIKVIRQQSSRHVTLFHRHITRVQSDVSMNSKICQDSILDDLLQEKTLTATSATELFIKTFNDAASLDEV